MRQALIFLSILFLFYGCTAQSLQLSQKEESANDKYEILNNLEKEKEQIYLNGYQQGLQESKQIIESFIYDIKMYQLGAYAIEKKLVTFPRVVAIKNNNKIQLETKGCEIYPKINDINDLFDFYKKYNQSQIKKETINPNNFTPKYDTPTRYYKVIDRSELKNDELPFFCKSSIDDDKIICNFDNEQQFIKMKQKILK